MSMDIGIPEEDRKAVAKGLSKLLADSYTLYMKTHYFHWNVTGRMFQTLHVMFEEQYMAMWPTLDEIAERIRALGEHAPGTYSAFTELASVKETKDVPSAMEMVQILVKDHEAVARTARELFPLAEKGNDEVSADLATQRLTFHEKTAWMLRSLLED